MSARGKAAAVVTSAGIPAAAWSAATLGGQTAIGTSISTVSGATYTSKAFISSVQSAVTKAKA